MAWYFSDRDHQVGTNNMAVYEAEYLYGSRFPVGAHYQLSDGLAIGRTLWDTFRSLSLVGGSRLTGGSFQAEALAGIGWAKGTDGINEGPGAGNRKIPFTTVDFPLLLRATWQKDWGGARTGIGPAFSAHLNPSNSTLAVLLHLSLGLGRP